MKIPRCHHAIAEKVRKIRQTFGDHMQHVPLALPGR